MIERSRKGINDKLTPDEREAFYDHSSPRTTAIVLAAIVENHLTALLRLMMVPETNLVGDLFNPTGPLGPFATKIRLAYLLRVISKSIADDLIIVTKIRNKFAHDLSVKSFERQQITDWVKNMQVYTILRELEQSARAKKREDDLESMAIADLLEHAFLSTRDSFRECLRLLIHQIADTEETIKAQGLFLGPIQPLSAS
jgi:DNA-binding MltR family transcriptional regulator